MCINLLDSLGLKVTAVYVSTIVYFINVYQTTKHNLN